MKKLALLPLLLAPTLALAAGAAPDKLDCAAMDCRAILPGAVAFDPPTATARWAVGRDDKGKIVGWVVLSTDIVNIKAYSSRPLVTLIGMDGEGIIRGAKVLHHSEPILLVGIPEKALTTFVDRYVGRFVGDKVVIGKSTDPTAFSIDVISGATVTALAQNQTILGASRKLALGVGVLSASGSGKGRFVAQERPWTWQEMEREGVFGRLTVTDAQMGVAGVGAFVDLFFTIADPPQVGVALLGKRNYDWMMKRAGDDRHLVVILGRGSNSFKGSGYVRGGIFDRVRIEQGMDQVIFRDTDFFNLSRPHAAGAPDFKEAAVFIAPHDKLHPGRPFDLVFIGSQYDGKGGFSRSFSAFSGRHALPAGMWKHDKVPPPPEAIWVQAWRNQGWHIGVVIGMWVLLIGLFSGRRWLTASMKRLNRIHTAYLLASFLVLGLWLRAQPSVTQALTLNDAVLKEWRWDLFLSEPALFVSWIGMAIVTVIWGRGVFCGWACPYGALNELLFKLGRLLRLPAFELPEAVHSKARWLRYGVFGVLVVTFVFSSETGELLAEVEPFKSTFFVAPWTREAIFLVWWLLLIGLSLVWFRPFCRYVCPLGAALAVPSSVRISGPHRRNACTSCKICTKGCEPRAIRPNGTIDPRECLSCMECEANYRDQQVCPPLVGIERLTMRARAKGEQPNADKMARLLHDREDV